MPGLAQAAAAVIAALQPGEVVTYGEVAVRAGRPGAARAVGALLARDGTGLPWWRVVRSGGGLAQGERQAALLRAEGVAARGGRITDRELARRLRADAVGGLAEGPGFEPGRQVYPHLPA